LTLLVFVSKYSLQDYIDKQESCQFDCGVWCDVARYQANLNQPRPMKLAVTHLG
jgi:hypothetical protein